MVRLAYVSLTLFSLQVSRVVANGTQFITGPCSTDADCAEGCCGFNTGLCAGPIIALTRDGGCGHGDAEPNANAANALGEGTFTVSGASSTTAATASTTASTDVAVTTTATATSSDAATTTAATASSTGTQFITGACDTDADCAEGCCGFNTGLCAGPIIALTRDGGCGHGDAEPNANAANALGEGTFTVSGTGSGTTAAAAVAETAATTTTATDVSSAASASATATATTTNKGAGNGVGAQFITGPCDTDADCASGCCGFNTGLCAGAIVAQERDGGCGHGDAEPNDNAAQALTGNAKRGLWDD